jgi:hypothetical protein
LSASDTRVTDLGLAHLEGLKRLSSLDVHQTQVGDAGLAHLEGLTGLTTSTSAARRSATPGWRI